MLEEFPNDSDGDALRQLVANGSDLSKEMQIDFAVLVPDRDMGLAFAKIVEPLGFQTDIEQGGETGRWTCYCSCKMVPTYDEMIAVQKMLAEVGQPFHAVPDGWGSFGNG